MVSLSHVGSSGFDGPADLEFLPAELAHFRSLVLLSELVPMVSSVSYVGSSGFDGLVNLEFLLVVLIVSHSLVLLSFVPNLVFPPHKISACGAVVLPVELVFLCNFRRQ